MFGYDFCFPHFILLKIICDTCQFYLSYTNWCSHFLFFILCVRHIFLFSRNVDDEREYLVKWKDLPYDECHWEVESDISAFQPQIEQFHERQSRGHKSRLKSSNRDGKESKFEKESRFKQKEFQQYEKSPKFLAGGTYFSFINPFSRKETWNYAFFTFSVLYNWIFLCYLCFCGVSLLLSPLFLLVRAMKQI